MQAGIVIIGHSHVECILAAAKASNRSDVDVISIQRLPDFRTATPDQTAAMVADAVRIGNPRAVCLCLFGNEHNIAGIIEHPQPFALTPPTASPATAVDPARWYIPHAVALDSFREWLAAADPISRALYNAFPDAQRFVFAPPPPISDWDHIVAHPDIFKDKLHLGAPPDPTRLALYGLQCQVLREAAEANGASTIALDPHVFDDRGFLKKGLYGADPTHGNLAYGTLMLAQILEHTGKVS